MYITYLLLAVTVLLSIKGFGDQSFRERMMFNAYDVAHRGGWYRCFTHAFVHGDYAHLAFNMFVLYVFGVQYTPNNSHGLAHLSLEPELVRLYNIKGYVIYGSLYVGGILFSTLWSLYRNRDNAYYNSLGASGATSAVIFAYILMNPMMELTVFPLPPDLGIPAFIFGPLLLISEYFLLRRGGTGIAHDAHISGAIFGVLFMAIIDFDLILNFISKFRI